MLTEIEHIADPVHAGEFVSNLDRGVVAQIELVVTIFGGIEGNYEQNVRVALAGGDPGLLHDIGEQRQSEVDAVLHQHLGKIEIHARLEGDRQGVRTVIARLR